MSHDQLSLFELPQPSVQRVGPASLDAGLQQVRSRLPAGLRLGTSSWTFSGWAGLVYDREAPARVLAQEGLAAYARHPLFRTVGIDRTFYGPIPAEAFQRYATAVPGDFAFVVKAHEWCTWARFPDHRRYGEHRGKINPFYLDAEYAVREVIEPCVEGLGSKLGALLFQFPPQELAVLGQRRGFARDLDRFLAALPRGPRYAFEFRTHQLFCADVIDTIRNHGAVYTFSVHPAMHELHHQIRHVDPRDDAYTVVRWMLARHYRFEEAERAYAPFDRRIDADPRTCASVLDLIRATQSQPTYVIVNNHAEGSAPLSIEWLVRKWAQEANP